MCLEQSHDVDVCDVRALGPRYLQGKPPLQIAVCVNDGSRTLAEIPPLAGSGSLISACNGPLK